MKNLVTIEKPHKIKLEYDVFGNKKHEPLLFLHGGGTDYHFYTEFLEELAKIFFVYTFSYPGFGKSTQINRYTLENIVNVIDSFIKEM